MKTQFILTPFFLDQATPELETLADPDWIINKPALLLGDTQARMSTTHKILAASVAESIQDGLLPVSIAGDCCATIGAVAGLQRAGLDPLLIWFDAHGDFNTWETTPSGFLGGMPLAMLAGLGEQTMPRAVGLRTVPHESIFLTDGRDLDPGEKLLLEGSGVNHLTDPTALLETVLPDRPIYVHFDVDVLDTADAPAMSYPAPGGPPISDLTTVFHHLYQTGQIAAISMSTWNPKLDVDGRSQAICMNSLQVLLGH